MIIDVSEWWIFISVLVESVRVIVGTVYFKPSLYLTVALELLQLVLTEIMEKFENALIIIGGDFNARVGEEDSLP